MTTIPNSKMVRDTRAVPGYRAMPIVFNEDDHFGFDQSRYNLRAAVSEYASWGYFDFRIGTEGFDFGYQSVPVNWRISSPRKRASFEKLAEIMGSKPLGRNFVQATSPSSGLREFGETRLPLESGTLCLQ